MKRSDLKSYIKEQIVSTLEEAVLHVDKGDQAAIDAAKKSADKDDIVKITEVEDEEGDKEAAKGARKNASKTKRLDAKIKAKKEIESDMKSILKKYKNAEGEDKEKYKDELKKKTSLKKETEAEIKTLEGDII